MCLCRTLDDHFIFVYSLVFFFKQKTAYDMRISDWSSDVCSSDLVSWLRCRRAGHHRDRAMQRVLERHDDDGAPLPELRELRSEEHTSELQSLMRISYAVFCLKKKNTHIHETWKNCHHPSHISAQQERHTTQRKRQHTTQNILQSV